MRSILFLLIFVSLQANAAHIGEVNSGELMLLASTGYEPAVQLKTDVQFDVTGMIAHVKLKQRFKNPSNDFIEGVYVFPLSERGAVNHLALVVGERKIVGSINEKVKAKRIYQQARSEGKKASLVSQSRPNLFRTRVANIPPHGEVEVEITLILPVNYDRGEFSIRFPLALTPRYIPGVPLNQKVNFSEGWGLPTSRVPDAHFITPWQGPDHSHELRVSGVIKTGMALATYGSTSHKIQSQLDSDVLRFELEPGEANHRDFVMRWRPRSKDAPVAAYFTERVGDEDFGLLMLMPPVFDSQETGNSFQRLPRELTFIIDTSGSMSGTSIEQARQSLLYSLKQLSPFDEFNIVEFNSRTRALFDEPQEANQMNVFQAIEFVQGLKAGGGTEIMPALKFALSGSSTERLQQIVFITDGAVGNETELFQLIHENLGSARLFTVGIGSAPNGYFMRTAAEFGRGTFTHVGALNEVSSSMSSLFEKLSKPVARDIEVDWPDDWQVFPRFSTDLYAGEPLLIAVKEGSQTQRISIRGKTATHNWEQVLDIGRSAYGKGVATLWARAKLKSVLDQKHRGVDEAVIQPEALKLALDHKLLSPYTSFVAVEEAVTRPAGNNLNTRLVTSPVPEGQNLQFMMPQTNTGWQMFMLAGLVLSLISLVGVRVL